MKILKVDEKWSVEFDENGRPMWILCEGERKLSAWDGFGEHEIALINALKEAQDLNRPIVKPMSEMPYDEPVAILFENGTVTTQFRYDQSLEEFLRESRNKYTGSPVGWFRSGDLP